MPTKRSASEGEDEDEEGEAGSAGLLVPVSVLRPLSDLLDCVAEFQPLTAADMNKVRVVTQGQ
jgi:hypothetical protein